MRPDGVGGSRPVPSETTTRHGTRGSGSGRLSYDTGVPPMVEPESSPH